MGKINDFFTKLTNSVGGYLVNSEREAGYRNAGFKMIDPVNGTQGDPVHTSPYSNFGLYPPQIPVSSSAKAESTGSTAPSLYSGSSGRAVQRVYEGAPYAQLYGMDQSTAYQEALANSAHQREMQDLKAAGLNPVLTATRGSGADVFSGSVYSPGGVSSSAKDSIDATAFGDLVGGVVGMFSPRLSLPAARLARGLVSVGSSSSAKSLFKGLIKD